ncbi:Glutaredoxin [Pleurostoma richardsiae]|uniref:Glutaredoxin n=1 Tax=Pleurostoma richardsiae TaxID=41990 RepID=A0AA38VCX8_9PEZI|nr:Glutaredoxin [Pleurostoma richardsiae]
MPSPRRIKILFIAVVAFVVVLLMWTSQLRQTRDADTRTIQDFYRKTVNAMDRADGSGQAAANVPEGKLPGKSSADKDRDGDVDADDEKLAKEMADRLKAAEQKAKDLANAKAPNKPDAPEKVIGVGSAANGQDKKGNVNGVDGFEELQETRETNEEHEVELTLNDILKKSPVIIFSKTYCQYSKRAKGILLDKYIIEPAPFVVELDTHPLGKEIQTRLGEMTGRRTVPNILINGKSIGGSDDVSELDTQHLLVNTIEKLGGKRMQIKERFSKVDNI